MSILVRIKVEKMLVPSSLSSWGALALALRCCSRLLGCDKLWVINKAVLVLVVALKDWVDHVLKLIISEDFLFWFRLPGLGVVVGLVVPVDEGLHELQPVQLVVSVSVVHLEVVKLELLLRHLGRVYMLNMLLHVLSLLGNPLLVLNNSPLLRLTLLRLALLWLPLKLLLGLSLELLLLGGLSLELRLLGGLSLELLLGLTLKLLLWLSLELLLLGLSLKLLLLGRRRGAPLELLWRRLTLKLLLWLTLELLRRWRLILELLLLLILLWIYPRYSPLLS